MTTLSSPPQATSPAPTGRTTFRTLAQATRPELPRPRHRRAAAHGDAAAGRPAVRRRPDRLVRLGGLAVAALSIGGGARRHRWSAPAADRFGQRPVLLGATVVQVLGIVGFLALSGLDSAGA